MSEVVEITADVTAQEVLTTRGDKQGVCYIVETAGNLGSGVVTILGRPGNSNMTWEILATPALGAQDVLWVGGEMDIAVTMTGSTTPDVNIGFTQV